MTNLILIRHGQTQWNVIGRYQGQADPELNALGWQQAKELARQLKEQGPTLDLIYSSPLKRAWQTAQVISQVLGVEVIPEPGLMEIHQGKWQTRLRSEIEANYPEEFKAWQTRPWETSPPGGENLRQVQKRVYQAVDKILTPNQGKTIALVSHRIPLLLLKMRYLGLDPDSIRTQELPNCSWEKIVINKVPKK